MKSGTTTAMSVTLTIQPVKKMFTPLERTDPRDLLKIWGFTNYHISRLRGTNRCSVSVEKHKDHVRRAHLINHYICGKNHWEIRIESSALRYALTGETMDEMRNADLTITDTIQYEEYQEYIKKFEGNVVNVIEIKPAPTYGIMPKLPRVDNKDRRVGSGGGSYGSVRFPSKKRGNATWKRFWKLFPMFDGYKSMDEYRKAMQEKMKNELQNG